MGNPANVNANLLHAIAFFAVMSDLFYSDFSGFSRVASLVCIGAACGGSISPGGSEDFAFYFVIALLLYQTCCFLTRTLLSYSISSLYS